MARLQVYLKVVIETDEETPRTDRLTTELCRQLQKVYGVREVEATSVVEEE
jgi:acetolactate synthase regulatory subunit